MDYREFRPRPPLASYIECFWTLAGDQRPSAPSPERILPDGCIELVLNFAAPFRRHCQDEASELQPLSIVVGQMDRHLLIEPTGRIDLIGIRFRPDGACPLLKFPPQELTGSIAALDEVSARLNREIESRMQGPSSVRARISLLEEMLIRQLNGSQDLDAVLRAAVDTIVNTRGQISIDVLADDLGISGRQLERKFKQMVGIEPKMLCRIIRFQEVFRAVEQHDARRWISVALECGYYDQAHFIRDFKQFSGLNPSSFFSEEPVLAQYFTRKDRPSDLYNTHP